MGIDFDGILEYAKIRDSYESIIQGGPKKGSHYRKSSLNRVKNRQPG